MSSYGQRTVARVGTSIRVSADGQPEPKVGGVTIDWSTVVAALASVTLTDGVPINVGDLYLRYGQVITKIATSAGAVSVVTVDATGGTFTITITSDVDGTVVAETSAALAEAATAAAVQTALRLLDTIPGYATIAVAGSAGGPYTITFPETSGYVTLTTNAALLTGGAATATVTVSVSGGNVGEYGPYDPDATDGRQTLVMGGTFILNRTVKQTDLLSDHPEAIFGGQVFLARIIQSGTATHTLALGPTLAEIKTTFPRLHLVTEAPAVG